MFQASPQPYQPVNAQNARGAGQRASEPKQPNPGQGHWPPNARAAERRRISAPASPGKPGRGQRPATPRVAGLSSKQPGHLSRRPQGIPMRGAGGWNAWHASPRLPPRACHLAPARLAAPARPRPRPATGRWPPPPPAPIFRARPPLVTARPASASPPARPILL